DRNDQIALGGHAFQDPRAGLIVEVDSLGPAVDGITVIPYARRSEVVGMTAGRQDQGVIGKSPVRKDAAVSDRHCTDMDTPSRAIDTLELARLEHKPTGARRGDKLCLL